MQPQTPAGSAPAAAEASPQHQLKTAAKVPAVASPAPRSQQPRNPGISDEPQLSKQAASGASRQAAGGSASAGRSSKASKRQSKVVQGKSAPSAAGVSCSCFADIALHLPCGCAAQHRVVSGCKSVREAQENEFHCLPGSFRSSACFHCGKHGLHQQGH